MTFEGGSLFSFFPLLSRFFSFFFWSLVLSLLSFLAFSQAPILFPPILLERVLIDVSDLRHDRI